MHYQKILGIAVTKKQSIPLSMHSGIFAEFFNWEKVSLSMFVASSFGSHFNLVLNNAISNVFATSTGHCTHYATKDASL